jgi:hypothetical protein
MDDWVFRAIKRWPNVPALYGWLKLDRRGRWLIRGETISRPQIVDVINRNYGSDDRGCWYFQNGPQRGYMELETAPFVVQVNDAGTALTTHNQLPVSVVSGVMLDENGTLYLLTEHGPGALLDSDLPWAVERMTVDNQPVDEKQIEMALACPNGQPTRLQFRWNGSISIHRLDSHEIPTRWRFTRQPQPPQIDSRS